MVIVDCPHPGCTFNTSNVADALAATLLQIHASGSHPGGTPDGGQNNETSTSAVVHVMKVQCLHYIGWTDLGYSSLQNRKLLHKFLPKQKSRERHSIIQDLKFLPTSSDRSSLPTIRR